MRLDIYLIIFPMKKNDDKINYSALARQYGCDYRTVKRYFESDIETTKERKKRKVNKLLDGLEEIIKSKVNVNAPVVSIFHLLRDNYSYKGSYCTVKNCAAIFKKDAIKQATLHFESNPGLQCQIDWKENLTLINKNGEIFIINIFLAILGYSRYKYIELTLDKTQTTLFRSLTNMFKYFEGAPHELLFDNMRTVVDQSRTQFGDPVYNSTFIQFARDANFTPKSCMAYRPQTKGKVETVAKIVNRLKVYNNEFETIDELTKIVNQLREDINNEIQATTKEKPIDRFQKEKEYLSKEVNYDLLSGYYTNSPIQRIVPRDCLINYLGKRYSIPPKYINKTVNLEIKENSLCIYYNSKFVCKHEINDKKINYLPEHYLEIAKYTLKDDNIDEICKRNLEQFDKL